MTPKPRAGVKVSAYGRDPFVTDSTEISRRDELIQQMFTERRLRREEGEFWNEIFQVWSAADPETDDWKTDTIVNGKRLKAVVDYLHTVKSRGRKKS